MKTAYLLPLFILSSSLSVDAANKKFAASPAKSPQVKKAAPHPFQGRMKGFWISQDANRFKWEFQPGTGSNGTLLAWFRDISYRKYPYVLKGKNQLWLPVQKVTYQISFDRDYIVLSTKGQSLRLKKDT